MSDVAIRVEGLGKQYKIGAQAETYQTARDVLIDTLAAPLIRFKRLLQGHAYGASNLTETVWALKDITFEVQYGEVIGIIGRNGAGKSTLLKILSQITEPTTGSATIYGRVGALLEVGTGFHPELTGRENIFLNGAILGMSRAEISHKFDEILDFAEIEKFIDTPVKHYSSGMVLRLGFAVAAHLEPEILIVDEVLAVGDAAFQAKCLGKMNTVAGEGRTVLFVSHNLAAVKALCSRTLMLNQGQVAYEGITEDVIRYYLAQAGPHSNKIATSDRQGQGPVRISDVRILDDHYQEVNLVNCGQEITIELSYTNEIPNGIPFGTTFHIFFADMLENPLFLCSTQFSADVPVEFPARGKLTCTIPRLPLVPGEYVVHVSCFVRGMKMLMDRINRVKIVSVVEGDFFGSGRLPPSGVGVFLVQNHWKVTQEDLISTHV